MALVAETGQQSTMKQIWIHRRIEEQGGAGKILPSRWPSTSILGFPGSPLQPPLPQDLPKLSWPYRACVVDQPGPLWRVGGADSRLRGGRGTRRVRRRRGGEAADALGGGGRERGDGEGKGEAAPWRRCEGEGKAAPRRTCKRRLPEGRCALKFGGRYAGHRCRK
jgi:hypothetical protein